MTDTRIAYLDAGGLRVVAGDGTGDRLLDRDAARVPPAWEPGDDCTRVAYVTAAATIVLRSATRGRVVWRAPIWRCPRSLEWSTDGRCSRSRRRSRIVVLDRHGHRRAARSRCSSGTSRDATFEPRDAPARASSVALARPAARFKLVDVDHPGHARLLFAGPGTFGDVVWSPDGRWLLVDWPTANQWVFLHGAQRARGREHPRSSSRARDDVGPMLRVAAAGAAR